MFSIFEKEGIMNADQGLRYRKIILEKGGTGPAPIRKGRGPTVLPGLVAGSVRGNYPRRQSRIF